MTYDAITSLLEMADEIGADVTMFDDRIPKAPEALRSWAASHGYDVAEDDMTYGDVLLHGRPMRVHTLKCRRVCVHLMNGGR